jgi:hypothetical protein
MSLIAEPIAAIWSTAFARLGVSGFTVKEKLALSVSSKVKASTLYTITATNATGQTATATVNLTTLLIVPAPATLTAVATGIPNEITLCAVVVGMALPGDFTFKRCGSSNGYGITKRFSTTIDCRYQMDIK